MKAPPRRTPAPADAGSLGKYRLLTRLGSGGMADVYLALAVSGGDSKFAKLSVVKRLKHSLADDPDTLAMFLSEAQLAARLNHPNVVQTFEAGRDGDEHFLVMEYLEGQSLDRLLRRAPEASARALPCLLRALCDALGGLHYAHELRDYDGTPLNVVHRDFGPRNVFVTYEGQAKVLDFGIAKALRASHVSRAGTLKGTVRYMAPEQAFGAAVDCRADIFAAGVILWEILAGRRMWPALDDIVVLQHLLQGRLPSLAEARPDAPAELARICDRALALEPAQRYPSAQSMRAELEAAIAALRLEATTADLAALVAELFRDDREALRQVVERQFASASEGTAGAPAASPSREAIPEAGRPAASPAEGPAAPLSPGEAVATDPPAPPRLMHSTPPPGSSYTTPGVTTSLALAGRRQLARRLAGPAAVVAIALAAFGTSRLNARRASSIEALEGEVPASSIDPVAPSSAPPSAPPPTAATAVLHLGSRPTGARVSLDAAPLGTTPLDVTVRRGRMHELRVEAPGYQAETRELSLEHDDNLDVSLSRTAHTSPRPSPPGAKPAQPDAIGTRLLEAAPPTKRAAPPLDKSSPYSTP